jgi:mono/diheme cytochrome c family protein
VEVFPEMHYQQSFRVQEPPRLAPPEGAVPVTGRELSYTAQELQALRNPLPRSLETLESGRALFETNCATCHGTRGRGDGPNSVFLKKYSYPSAPDLTAPTTQSRSDGEIFGIVTNGIVVMPSFKNLLSERERWTLVHYLRALGGQ